MTLSPRIKIHSIRVMSALIEPFVKRVEKQVNKQWPDSRNVETYLSKQTYERCREMTYQNILTLYPVLVINKFTEQITAIESYLDMHFDYITLTEDKQNDNQKT